MEQDQKRAQLCANAICDGLQTMPTPMQMMKQHTVMRFGGAQLLAAALLRGGFSLRRFESVSRAQALAHSGLGRQRCSTLSVPLRHLAGVLSPQTVASACAQKSR